MPRAEDCVVIICLKELEMLEIPKHLLPSVSAGVNAGSGGPANADESWQLEAMLIASSSNGD